MVDIRFVEFLVTISAAAATLWCKLRCRCSIVQSLWLVDFVVMDGNCILLIICLRLDCTHVADEFFCMFKGLAKSHALSCDAIVLYILNHNSRRDALHLFFRRVR